MRQRDLWNERYRAKGAVWGAEPNRFVAELLGGIAPQRVLDLGSGQGRNAIWLAQQGHSVTAVDVSDVATEQARAAAESTGVNAEFIAADLETWEPPEDSFDLVLLAYMQAPDEMRRKIHATAATALVPGGRVLIIAHHKDNLEQGVGGPPMPEVLFDESQIAGDFDNYEVEQNRRVERPVEGSDVPALDLLFSAVKPA